MFCCQNEWMKWIKTDATVSSKEMMSVFPFKIHAKGTWIVYCDVCDVHDDSHPAAVMTLRERPWQWSPITRSDCKKHLADITVSLFSKQCTCDISALFYF